MNESDAWNFHGPVKDDENLAIPKQLAKPQETSTLKSKEQKDVCMYYYYYFSSCGVKRVQSTEVHECFACVSDKSCVRQEFVPYNLCALVTKSVKSETKRRN